MRARRPFLLALMLVMLGVPAAAAVAGGSTTRPTAVGIAEREHYITPYRRSVPVGAVKLNIRNFGEDTHNLVVRGPKRFVAIGPDLEPGTNATWTVKLRRAGTYQLLCTRANHLKLGMRSSIKVVAPKKKR